MPKGERRHPRAVLTQKKVNEIRSLIGTMSMRQIAKLCGTQHSTVSRINSGQMWA